MILFSELSPNVPPHFAVSKPSPPFNQPLLLLLLQHAVHRKYKERTKRTSTVIMLYGIL